MQCTTNKCPTALARHGAVWYAAEAMVRRAHAVRVVAVFLAACGGGSGEQVAGDAASPDASLAGEVELLETLDVSAFNQAWDETQPTVDIAFYVTEGGPIGWDQLAPTIETAQEIFAGVGVQLRVTSAVRIAVPDEWQTLDVELSEPPTTPEYLETDLYAHLNEIQTRLPRRNIDILNAILAQYPTQDHGVGREDTVHVVTLNEVPISYFEWTGTTFQEGVVPTGALSFPPYVHADRIPRAMRGVITYSRSPSILSPIGRVLAHELGHKLINVSHEGIGVCPSFEADGDDLMLYGGGTRIPAEAEGRYQRERLALSPFLYTLQGGVANFANRYQDGGIYRDRLYGSLAIDPPCPQE